jgi:hypothetical protein
LGAVNQFFIAVTNAWEKQFNNRKDLFWPRVCEVSLHGWLAPLLYVPEVRQNIMVSEAWGGTKQLTSQWKGRTGRVRVGRVRERQTDRPGQGHASN